MTPPLDLIVCVENGSTPEEVSMVRAAAPPLTVVLELAYNIGFAGGCNTGMSLALERGADWVLLLNNDATVIPGCLAACLAEAEDRVAAVGPAVAFRDEPDKLWFAGGAVSHRFAFTRHHGLNRPAVNPPPSADSSYISACCVLVSAQAWKEVGPFRSDYFSYYEDAEWCQRARARGWRCRYLGQVLCHHAVSVSSEQRGSIGLSDNTAYYLARNPFRFAIESRPLWLAFTRLLGLGVVWNAYNAWRVLRSGRISVARAYLAGLGDALRGRMGQRPG
jgi:GT2 family glycosyltransferase